LLSDLPKQTNDNLKINESVFKLQINAKNRKHFQVKQRNDNLTQAVKEESQGLTGFSGPAGMHRRQHTKSTALPPVRSQQTLEKQPLYR